MATKKTVSEAAGLGNSAATKAADKAAELVKAVETKVAEVKQVAEKKTAAKTAKAAEKKPVAAKKIHENVYIQYAGTEISAEQLVEKAKEVAGVKSVKSIDVYVKPEENTAYYVIDGDNFGKFEL